jgi:hypothetical protein
LKTEIFNQNEQKVMTGSAQVKITTAISINLQKPIEPLNIVDIESTLLQEKSSDKKVALVTESSRGIGKKVAKKLAQKNYLAVVNYKNNKSMVDEVVDSIISLGGEAISIYANISNEREVDCHIEEVEKM